LHTIGGVASFQRDISTAAEDHFLLKQNRFGRHLALMDPHPGVWRFLLGNVAADPSAQDVMYKLLKIKLSMTDRRQEVALAATGLAVR
jgi:hypothetical protein